MQPGLNIVDFTTEIERQAKSKRDFIGDTRKMESGTKTGVYRKPTDPFYKTPSVLGES